MLSDTAHLVYTAAATLCRGFRFVNYFALGSIDFSLRASLEGSDPIIKVYLGCMMIALVSYQFRQSLGIFQRDAQIFAIQIDSCLRTLANRPEPRGSRVARENKFAKVMAELAGAINLARHALYTWRGVDELRGWRAGR
jgi:hypothetical protein